MVSGLVQKNGLRISISLQKIPSGSPSANQHQQSPVLLIVDRRDDPVTPLLNQWTYHAMIHELLGIENNRVDLRKAPGVSQEQKEIAISVVHDQFFAENLHSNFGDLGASRNFFFKHIFLFVLTLVLFELVVF